MSISLKRYFVSLFWGFWLRFLTSALEFLQSRQTHLAGLQRTPIWKHSQYFFWQPDLLHLQPVMWYAGPDFLLSEGFLSLFFVWELACFYSFGRSTFETFCLKACGFLFLMFFLDSFIRDILHSRLWQLLQRHFSSQKRPAVKHSQYIFKHLLLEHLQTRFAVDSDLCLSNDYYGFNARSVYYFSIVFLPSPLLFFEELADPLVNIP